MENLEHWNNAGGGVKWMMHDIRTTVGCLPKGLNGVTMWLRNFILNGYICNMFAYAYIIEWLNICPTKYTFMITVFITKVGKMKLPEWPSGGKRVNTRPFMHMRIFSSESKGRCRRHTAAGNGKLLLTQNEIWRSWRWNPKMWKCSVVHL